MEYKFLFMDELLTIILKVGRYTFLTASIVFLTTASDKSIITALIPASFLVLSNSLHESIITFSLFLIFYINAYCQLSNPYRFMGAVTALSLLGQFEKHLNTIEEPTKKEIKVNADKNPVVVK